MSKRRIGNPIEEKTSMERASLETVADQQVLYLTTIGRATGLPREIEIWFVLQSRAELFRLRRMVVVADDLFEQTSAHREQNPRRVGLDARSGFPKDFACVTPPPPPHMTTGRAPS
jgi:hypothetical protein